MAAAKNDDVAVAVMIRPLVQSELDEGSRECLRVQPGMSQVSVVTTLRGRGQSLEQMGTCGARGDHTNTHTHAYRKAFPSSPSIGNLSAVQVQQLLVKTCVPKSAVSDVCKTGKLFL